MRKQKQQRKFNLYWIYAGIALFFISLQLFNAISNPMEKITKKRFLTELLIEDEVEKVIIVNNEFVEVFIKESKLDKEKHQKVVSKGLGSNIGPHYYFNITNGEQFENDLKEFYKENFTENPKDHIVPDVDTRKNLFGTRFS